VLPELPAGCLDIAGISDLVARRVILCCPTKQSYATLTTSFENQSRSKCRWPTPVSVGFGVCLRLAEAAFPVGCGLPDHKQCTPRAASQTVSFQTWRSETPLRYTKTGVHPSGPSLPPTSRAPVRRQQALLPNVA
jgi:hypothetical protein